MHPGRHGWWHRIDGWASRVAIGPLAWLRPRSLGKRWEERPEWTTVVPITTASLHVRWLCKGKMKTLASSTMFLLISSLFYEFAPSKLFLEICYLCKIFIICNLPQHQIEWIILLGALVWPTGPRPKFYPWRGSNGQNRTIWIDSLDHRFRDPLILLVNSVQPIHVCMWNHRSIKDAYVVTWFVSLCCAGKAHAHVLKTGDRNGGRDPSMHISQACTCPIYGVPVQLVVQAVRVDPYTGSDKALILWKDT
jgi:hypothetical protein